MPQIMPIIADIRSCDDEPKQINEKDCAILTLRNMVLFPGVTMPVAVGRNASLRLIDDARKTNSLIGVVCQKSAEVEVPSKYDIYHIGVIAEIVNVLELPDNSTNVILHGKVAFHLDEITQMAPYIKGSISYIEQEMPPKDDNEFAALSSSISELTIDMFQKMGDNGKEMSYAIKNIKDSDYLINFLACNSPFEPDVKMKFLTENSVKTRAYLLYKELTKESQLLDLKAAIQSRTREELTQQQRDHFLQQQIRTIQDELGINEFSDIDKFESRAKKMKWSKEVKEQFQKELAKLERLNPQSPDYSVQYTYLDQILNLPWNVFTRDSFNLAKVEKKLNHDHYGLENVKDRILEHLSVLKLRGDMKSPIICLYGPPGVGKTSLGRSIADALNRKYARISLGGLHDEAEIRGHRRTYIGAMPGRIIQALIRCKSSNPVFVLDEIDKIGNDFKGDPASALLEVLDPEQNSHFHDNYIDIDYDLSNVLFIATANSLSTISQPLLDRMEVIDISGYIQEEKVEIARKHLLPKQLQENGFEKSEISFTKQALAKIIDSYTRESGVRELDKKIAKVLRKIARIKATAEKPVPTTVNLDNLREYLGPEDYSRDRYEGNEFAGVVTGLAWTAVGGEILFVESSLSKGKGEKLTLTGNLGDVMKESAVIAMQYLKSHSQMLGIDYELFDKYNVHIHVPEGAIPKDGPSAGITMVTSLASSFTQRKVRDH